MEPALWSVYRLKTESTNLRYSYSKILGRPEVEPKKSVFGLVRLDNEKDALSITQIETKMARRIITKRKRESALLGDLVHVNKRGKVAPANVPDIVDMAMLPKALKAMVLWVFKETEKDGTLELIHKSIRVFVDPEPCIPLIREYCVLKERKNDISYNSFSNAFKEIIIEENMELACIQARYELMTNEPDDGRKWTVQVQVERCARNVSETHIVIWNCRGMARPSFIPHILHVIKYHRPEVIILTKIRISEEMTKVITGNLKLKGLWIKGAVNYSAGCCVMMCHGEMMLKGNIGDDEREIMVSS